MIKIIILFLFSGFVNELSSQNKVVKNLYVDNYYFKKYPLLTPDHLAFRNKLNKKIISAEIESVGYGSVVIKGKKVKVYPVFYQGQSKDKPKILALFFLNEQNKQTGSIVISQNNYKKGLFEFGSETETNAYFSQSTDDGCGLMEFYGLLVNEINVRSFFKIIYFNDQTGELKARFRLNISMDDYNRKQYPNSRVQILFEDGIVHTKLFIPE
ncbi:MAG: hypothetical protein ABIO44_06255 [Saprospiraceae bacterium]